MALSRTSPSRGPGSPDVTGFYDDATGSIQYVVSDPETRKAALVDIVLDFDPKSAATNADGAQAIVDYCTSEGVQIEWILDTHPHADHLMASSFLKGQLGAPNAVGAKVKEIAELWRDYYHLPNAFDPEQDFDHLFEDGDTFQIGNLPVRVMLSPGHTLGSISYIIGKDCAMVHDTFMQPDVGTSRADFPGGSAAELYDTLQNLLALPGDTRLFIGRDYGSDYRKMPEWEATVDQQRKHNTHIGGGTPKEAYVDRRTARDKTLALPDRMLHVLQMNLRAGQAPEPESDGTSYLKIPLNTF